MRMQDNTTLIVSVIMGTLYRSRDTSLLARSVNSILEQTVSEIELLICDDGSTDEARALLDDYAKRDGRVRLVRPGGMFSLSQKLNSCLQTAQGRYIARMDDDDFSHVDRLERQLRCLREHPETDFVGCCANIVRSGKVIGMREFPEFPKVEDFFFVQPFLHPSLIFRCEAIQTVGGYSESRYCELCEDYDLLLRMYEVNLVGMNLQTPLLDYTISETAKGSRTMRHRWNEAVTRYRHFKTLKALPKAWPYVLKPLAVGLVPPRILAKAKERRYGV